MQIVDLLRRTTLFGQVPEQHLSQVAQRCVAEDARAGTIITQQGDLGSAFVVIESGEAVAHRIDDEGKQRPVGMLGPGDAYGTASLFLGEPRDVTITATSPMRVWILERQALESLLDEVPSLWDELSLPESLVQQLDTSRQEWLEAGEIVVAITRRHWLVLLRGCLFPTLALLTYAALLAMVERQGGSIAPWSLFVIPALLLYLVSMAWVYVDWHNDYLAVTNRRVAHQERIALLYESRDEIILDRIQNLQVSRGLWGSTFGFGDITLETAARSGHLRFTAAPHPETLHDLIFEEQARFLAARRAAERRLIKRSLAAKLAPEAMLPEEEALVPERALGEAEEPPETATEGPMRHWIARLLGPGLTPRTIAAENAAIWRKHWLAALASAFVPGAMLIVLLALTATSLGKRLFPTPLTGQLGVTIGVLYAALLLWLVWKLLDWANDVYVVTSDRIIHIERRPLLFSEKRREASLSMIQHVSLRIPHMLANLLNYGDVLVETAGPGEFAFRRVARPREVQREIFRRIEAHREEQRERDAARQRAELTEWFDVFQKMHVQAERGAPDADTPTTSLDEGVE
ncbi:MAG: PH domain-containing protein [Anaerolineae bacterium]